MSDPARILMIRPSALGDVCRTVPVLAALKRRFPHAEIDWLVQDAFAPAIEHHPDLHHAIPFRRRQVAVRRWWRASARRELRALLVQLREAKYDLVLDLQGLVRSGIFAWTTRAPDRIGFRNAREFGWLGLTRRVKSPSDRHTVDRMLDLVGAAGASELKLPADMRLFTSAADRQWLDSSWRNDPFAVIAPTSRWPGKRWPDESFAQLSTRLLQSGAVHRLVIVGAESERSQCPRTLDLASRDARVVDLVGGTTIGQLMALIEASCLVIANDSAALHMGVGFDKPVIGLFGPTRTDLVGPYRRKHDVIQRADPGARNRHKHAQSGVAAMEQIAVAEVLEAAQARLGAEVQA